MALDNPWAFIKGINRSNASAIPFLTSLLLGIRPNVAYAHSALATFCSFISGAVLAAAAASDAHV